MPLGFKNDALNLQIKKNLEELKQSAEEKVAAVKKAEEGASDLKKRAEELSMSLEAHEKEYQVSTQDFLWGSLHNAYQILSYLYQLIPILL